MSTKTAFIHIGLAKTGSTAIQFALRSRAGQLDEAGIRVPETGRFGPAAGHHCLAWSLRDDPKALANCPTYSFEQTADEIDASEHPALVLSSEEFSLLAYRPKGLQRFRSLFARRRLVGIVYVREQVELFNSFYVELLKDFSTEESIGECVQRLSGESRYDYSKWLGAWDTVFDQLVVRPYDRNELAGGDVIKDFFAQLGVPDLAPRGANPRFANESLTREHVAALQYIVRRLGREGITRRSAGAQQWIAMRNRLHKVVRELPGMRAGKYWGIPPAVARSLREKYREPNDTFFREYLGREFVFSATQADKPLNSIRFTDLPSEHRRAVEAAIEEELRALRTAPPVHDQGAAGKG